MNTIEKIRAKFPKSAGVSDGDLLVATHRKFYPHMHIKDFFAKVDPDDRARFTITDKMWDYWEEAVQLPKDGETVDETRERTMGADMRGKTDSTTEGVTRSYVQGSMMNWGDEAVGLGAAALHPVVHGDDGSTFGERYEAYSNREREKLDDFRESHPVTSTVAEIGGNLTTAATALGAGATLFKGSQTVPQLMVAGGAEGLVYGAAAGTGNEAEDRFMGFVSGAATGGAIGAIAPWAINAVTKAGKGVISKFSTRTKTPKEQATARLAKIVDETGMSPDEIMKRLDDLGDEAMLIDALGETGGAAARSAANVSPVARDVLKSASADRMAGQTDRLSEALLKAADLDNPVTVRELTEGAKKAAKPAIDAAYKEAREAGFDLPREPFRKFFESKAFTDAYNEAGHALVDRAAIEGIDATSQLARYDFTKRILDSKAKAARIGGNDELADRLGALARGLRETVDQYTPEYGGARKLAQNLAKQEKTFELGAEGAKTRIPADYTRRVEEVEGSGLTNVAKGYAAGKIDQIENRRGTPGLIDAVFGPKRQKQAMDAALGPNAEGVKQQIARERTFANSHAAIGANSTTAQQAVETAAFGAGAGFTASGGEPTTAALGAMVGMIARKLGAAGVKKINAANEAKVAPIVAEILTGRKLPEEAAKRIMKDPRVQKLISRAMSMQAGGETRWYAKAQ